MTHVDEICPIVLRCLCLANKILPGVDDRQSTINIVQPGKYILRVFRSRSQNACFMETVIIEDSYACLNIGTYNADSIHFSFYSRESSPGINLMPTDLNLYQNLEKLLNKLVNPCCDNLTKNTVSLILASENKKEYLEINHKIRKTCPDCKSRISFDENPQNYDRFRKIANNIK